ncbi:MAG: pseudaminic acid biosynthesis-associated methylase [Alphaproteobacteria bacterium]
MTYKTDQEEFWAGEFGDEYTNRNQGEQLLISNIALFAQILKAAPPATVNSHGIKSIVELGCNRGLNLQALKKINSAFELCGYEINEQAATEAQAAGVGRIVNRTILDQLPSDSTYDLAFTKGVLIHINPDVLDRVYDNLYNLSRRYILICEYYNPSPVTVTYRGKSDRLFKRDFAGELIAKYNLRLVHYGFVYHRDYYFPQDDITWFLLEK